ncbi:hypothetical protein CLOM_g6784 [Closterium sp. NIES-68]|nr:hypothetical protein CLOM_g6784 [Closterium sp. NIES-68]
MAAALQGATLRLAVRQQQPHGPPAGRDHGAGGVVLQNPKTREWQRGGAGGGSGRHRKVKWKSLDTFVRRLHARRRALSHLHPPPHGLCGCVTLEVCWSDVRGLRYENELQAEANLAMEVTRVVKREFDSFDLAVQAHALRLNASPPVHGTQLSQTSLPAASPGVSAGPWVGRSFSGKRLELGSPLASAAAAGGGGGAAAVAGGGGGRVCSAGSSFSAGEPGSRLAAAAAAGRSAGASFASAGSGAAMYAGFGYGAAAAGGCDLWGGQRQACIGSPRRVLFLEPQSRALQYHSDCTLLRVLLVLLLVLPLLLRQERSWWRFQAHEADCQIHSCAVLTITNTNTTTSSTNTTTNSTNTTTNSTSTTTNSTSTTATTTTIARRQAQASPVRSSTRG